MARYTGPKCRICRQLGFSVCGTENCALVRRSTPPGMHPDFRRKMNDYKKRLLEKRKLKFSYWISETQFRNYGEKAFRKPGVAGETLLSLFERRLDNLVHRFGFAPTILAARQMFIHGHIMVNSRKVDRPSYLLRRGDIVSLTEKSKKMPLVEDALAGSLSRPTPPYLEVDKTNLIGTLVGIPERDQIPLEINEHLVMEQCTKCL